MFGADTRGQAIQIGAVVLFSFVVLTFSLYQATVVPDQNREIEFDHSQAVNDDLRELRSDLVTATDTGDPRAATVALGARYPARVLALNPAFPSGSLRTAGAGEVSITVSGGSVDAGGLCGTASAPVSRSLVFDTPYNYYAEAPTAGYENGLFFREFESSTRTSDTAFVTGNTVRLRPLTTEYAASATDARSVDLVPTEKVGRERVTLDGGAGETLTVTIPSRVPVSRWSELFADRSDVSAADPDTADGLLDVVVAPSGTETYTLLCTPVGINRQPAATPPDVRDPAPTGGSGIETATVLFADSFERSGIGPEWQAFGSFDPDGGTGTATQESSDGSRAGLIDSGDDGGIAMATGAAVDTSGAETVRVELWAQEGFEGSSGPEEEDDGEDLLVEYYTDAGGWDTVARLPADDEVDEREFPTTIELRDQDAKHSDFRIRLRQRSADAGSDEWLVDDVRISSVTANAAGGGGGSGGGGGGGGGPTASLSVTKTNDGPGNSADTYELDASASTGTVNEYRWDFDNDGTIDLTTSSSTVSKDYQPSNKPTEARVVVVAPDGQDQTTEPYP